MSINASINMVICSYMNTASAHGKEKSAHTHYPSAQSPKEKQRRSDYRSGERKR